MSMQVIISSESNILAPSRDGGRLMLVEPSKEAPPHQWELSYNSRCWSLQSAAPHNLYIELHPDERSFTLSGSGRQPISSEYLEVTRGDNEGAISISRIRFAGGSSDVQQFRLEVAAEDDKRPNTTLLICRASGESTWTYLLERNFPKYDFVIPGSSFCCLAFVCQIQRNNPNAKFLILETGKKDLCLHHQSLAPSAEKTASKMAVRPWSVSELMKQGQIITNLHGQIPYLGGRSTYWSGWCPEPSEDELAGWPVELKTILPQYCELARKFLGVIEAIEVNNGQIYGSVLQHLLQERSQVGGSITAILPAPLAMGDTRSEKFSTPGPLQAIKCDNIQTLENCTVEKIVHDGKKATHLKTSRGYIPLGNAKLILAMSTLPSTTLVLNSFNKAEFPHLANVGERFTAHFVSSVVARAPRSALPVLPSDQGIQLGAVYIVGKQEAQFHLQLSAAATCKPDSDDLERCRRYSANSIPPACIKDSPEHVLISCSALGELDHKNQNNWFRLKEDVHHGDLTSNCELQIIPNKQDMKLWGSMDDVMFEMIENNLSSTHSKVEYRHEGEDVWKTERPKRDCINKTDTVHDASTMWVGDDEDTKAPVGLDYCLRGVDNVYITGGALWPTGGSWNPVLTIVAMAMHLADTLCSTKKDG